MNLVIFSAQSKLLLHDVPITFHVTISRLRKLYLTTLIHYG